ncbi:phosphoserine phosphatase [Sporosarcina sp. P26b]|uniref:PP2C family serine/threonine-protein phosphatase n=1 Tax=Sporosarcina TaxID=1569 RepID=UPI000A17C61F|nr:MULTISPECIES: PP2C family serine/threonine-protein phosphatase [Sporosarcina]ARK21384.1 phosphoserine phosphatase [Sporosarcina ureae]PIC72352.1 phosphoserine phosphatase [Sporosarcina sp. P17b]PIC96392.1 phosphoserine phosphatase [Sporosarcina sp. P26b]
METFENDYVEAYIYQQSKKGNKDSGDAYYIHSEEDYFICAIADGLGSGTEAKESAEIIPQVLKLYHHESPDDLLHRCNKKMLHKRGAAVGIVKVYFEQQTLEYSCVGNIRIYILQSSGQMIYPLPVMGYLSGRPQSPRTQRYPYNKNDRFFLHSDGVNLRSPKKYLQENSTPYQLYKKVEGTIEDNDDATFISASLLH